MLNSNGDTKSWALSITNYTFGEVSVVYKRTSETITKTYKDYSKDFGLRKEGINAK